MQRLRNLKGWLRNLGVRIDNYPPIWGFILIYGLVALIICIVICSWPRNYHLATFFTSAVAAIAYPVFALLNRYFWVPKLEIFFNPNNHDLHTPTLTVINQQNGTAIKTHFIRVGVTNNGTGAAKHCIGEIQLIQRPDGCEAFSKEGKALLWTRSQDSIRISRKQIATLNVAISQEEVSATFGGKYSKQKDPLLKAWAATPEVIDTMGPKHRPQDGFCIGDFKIRVTVYSENAEPASKDFILKIKGKWDELSMEPCDEGA